MRNIETRNYEVDVDAMTVLLNKARNEERKERAQVVSDRLAELAIHIDLEGLSGVEAAELIRREVERYRNEAQELH